MNVCVCGLWHLGTVTAACLAAAGHKVMAVDPDARVVHMLAAGTPPLFEPGLADLVKQGIASGVLRFTGDVPAAVRDADVVWLTSDTPVDDDDRADVEAVIRVATATFPYLRDGALMLVSSQLPVGTTRRLEEMFQQQASGRQVGFAYSPENLRLGKAIEVFSHPDRVVAGTRSEKDREKIARLLAPFTSNIQWMSVESAEMTKHALNAFLATSVTFINEVAAICEQVGADASEVARGLKSEARIGPGAYLSPGGAFAGGTLARDIAFLSHLGAERGLGLPLLSSVKTSNDAHRLWAQRRLSDVLGDVAGKTIAIWGLTYKPGTSTLRRSSALELCRWLLDRGARVSAHDPAVRTLPAEFVTRLDLANDPISAVSGASALVVATPWPEYRDVDPGGVVEAMSGNLVLDANGFLAATLGTREGLTFLSVGKPVR